MSSEKAAAFLHLKLWFSEEFLSPSGEFHHRTVCVFQGVTPEGLKVTASLDWFSTGLWFIDDGILNFLLSQVKMVNQAIPLIKISYCLIGEHLPSSEVMSPAQHLSRIAKINFTIIKSTDLMDSSAPYVQHMF